MWQLGTQAECVAKCEAMGHNCAGFSQEVISGKVRARGRRVGYTPYRHSHPGTTALATDPLSTPAAASPQCEIVPRGYGLATDFSHNFYRKKDNPATVRWQVHSGSAVPDTSYEWYSLNGSIATIRSKCAPDARCAGYFMCTKIEGGSESSSDQPKTTCDHLKTKADGVLLSGVPAPHLLLRAPGATIYAKTEAQTCEGTAEGATCSFPFRSVGTGVPLQPRVPHRQGQA